MIQVKEFKDISVFHFQKRVIMKHSLIQILIQKKKKVLFLGILVTYRRQSNNKFFCVVSNVVYFEKKKFLYLIQVKEFKDISVFHFQKRVIMKNSLIQILIQKKKFSFCWVFGKLKTPMKQQVFLFCKLRS